MTETHKNAARILKAWNLEGEPLTAIDNEDNKNHSACYVGEEYVLKYTAEFSKLNSHIRVSKAIESVGLLAATPVATTDSREYIQDGEGYFYLTRRLRGQPMGSGAFCNGDAAGNARFLGEIIGQLHIALSKVDEEVNEADLLETVRDWALPQSKAALNLSEEFCREYINTMSDLYPKLPRQIIHRDPNPGNIIRSEDQWGFIDFDLAQRNVRIYDPCYGATAVLSECFGKNHEQWLEVYRNMVWGYDSVAHLTEAERRAIPYVLLANQFVCVAWFANQDKYAELFETNKEMTLWLIQQFEVLKDI